MPKQKKKTFIENSEPCRMYQVNVCGGLSCVENQVEKLLLAGAALEREWRVQRDPSGTMGEQGWPQELQGTSA